jgi:LysM repeat protein
MFRITAFVLAAMALSIARTPAQDPSPELIELRELRVILEQHSKRLEAIQEQLNELRASAEKEAKEKSSLETSSVASPNAVPPENPKPSQGGPILPSSTEGKAPGEIGKEAPKAEAAPSSARHVVVKGETLTSIARHYNISLSELQRVNKIENDRKLQIGQSLVIPLSKLPETQTQKSP